MASNLKFYIIISCMAPIKFINLKQLVLDCHNRLYPSPSQLNSLTIEEVHKFDKLWLIDFIPLNWLIIYTMPLTCTCFYSFICYDFFFILIRLHVILYFSRLSKSKVMELHLTFWTVMVSQVFNELKNYGNNRKSKTKYDLNFYLYPFNTEWTISSLLRKLEC